jgi:hypothetical protein
MHSHKGKINSYVLCKVGFSLIVAEVSREVAREGLLGDFVVEDSGPVAERKLKGLQV